MHSVLCTLSEVSKGVKRKHEDEEKDEEEEEDEEEN